MGSVVLVGGRFVIFRNYFFKLQNVQIKTVPSCKTVDLLLLGNKVSRVRNVQKWSVLSSNEVDLLMLKNRVYRLLNVEKCAVPSRKCLIC